MLPVLEGVLEAELDEESFIVEVADAVVDMVVGAEEDEEEEEEEDDASVALRVPQLAF